MREGEKKRAREITLTARKAVRDDEDLHGRSVADHEMNRHPL
jgi:hypothetical protein